MERRDFFKAFAVAGAFMASRRGEAAAQSEMEGGSSGPWPNWPFEEIRIPYQERAKKFAGPTGAL